MISGYAAAAADNAPQGADNAAKPQFQCLVERPRLATYVNAFSSVDDVEPQVSVTSTVPAACAGATTVAVVALLNTALVTGIPPKETMQPADRFAP